MPGLLFEYPKSRSNLREYSLSRNHSDPMFVFAFVHSVPRPAIGMLDQAKHRILAAPSVMAGVDLSRPLAEILQDAADAPALRVRLAVLEQEIPVAQRVVYIVFCASFVGGEVCPFQWHLVSSSCFWEGVAFQARCFSFCLGQFPQKMSTSQRRMPFCLFPWKSTGLRGNG